MAQSALTVTTPNPTPPTNMSFTGATGPNPPNYTKLSYAGMELDPPTNPPPYFDDGTAGSLVAFAANTAALASGTGATSGGTEGSYPGTGTAPPANPNFNGAVPASTSVAHEAAGTEVVVVAPGNISHTFPGPTTVETTRSVSVGPALTAASIAAGPNASHASSLSPAVNPTLTGITPGNSVSGVGTTTLGATGTNFTRQSVIYVNGVAQTTTYVSATSLTAPTVTKKTSAGPWLVIVVTGGAVQTAAQTWTFT